MSKRIWTNGQFNQTKEFGRIMCHYLLMNIYHIKENVLHLWELYVGFQNLVQEKTKLMWIWALVCSSWLKLFMIEVEKKNLCWYLIIYLMCVLIIIYIVIISCLRLKLFIFFQNVRLFLLKFFWKNMKWFSLDKCRLVRGIASLPMLKCVALLCQMLVRYFSNQYVSFLMWMVCT